MNTSVVQGLEQQLEDAKALVARRNLATKLANNVEFRQLILEGFCLRDSARFAHESSDPALTAEMRADALAMAQAGGHLKRYLSAAFMMGASAEGQMGDIETALEEARQEEELPGDEDAGQGPTDDAEGELA